MERWQNKVAVVTGATSGIGAAIVKDFLSSGLQVVGLGRRVEVLTESRQKLPQELQKSFTVHKCDVGDAKCVNQVFDKIIDQLGGVDILVNSAAVMNGGSLLTDEVSKMQEVMQTNIMGVIHCTKRAFQSMKERNFDGHIILLNSIVGHSIPCLSNAISPQVGGYVASKHAITALTEMYRQEFMYYETKIKITSISPGVTDTEMVPFWLRTACDGNLLNVKDIAAAVIYAVSTPPTVQVHEMVVKPVAELFS